MDENTNNNALVEEGAEEAAKTYTQEEVDALLQAETDRRVNQALSKAQKKNEQKVKEAEKLARMNESEKYQYELEQREKAIEEREKALALSENKNEASKILSEKGISLELVDFVVSDDAETMAANIKLLDKAFKASIKNEINKRLGGKAPEGNHKADDAITKKDFAKMTIAEQQKLYKEDPDLYKSLIG